MTSLISAITAYIIVVSTFYLMGYWSEFGVNHLEYITISQVATVALDSLIASFGYIALGTLLSHIYLGDKFKVGAGRYTPEGYFLNKWWKLLILPIVVITLYGIYTNKPLGLFFAALIFSPIIGIWLGNQGFLESIVKNPEIRFSIINMAILIVFLAQPKGFLDAYSRKEATNKFQVIVNNVQYTYVGKLNNSLFLYDKKNGRTIQLTPIPHEVQYISNKLSKKDTANGKS